jgi:hypothetical protein
MRSKLILLVLLLIIITLGYVIFRLVFSNVPNCSAILNYSGNDFAIGLHRPYDNEGVVPLSSPIEIYFTKPVDINTLENNIAMKYPDTDQEIEFDWRYQDQKNDQRCPHLLIQPRADFVSDSKVEVRLDFNIQDINGHKLADDSLIYRYLDNQNAWDEFTYNELAEFDPGQGFKFIFYTE